MIRNGRREMTKSPKKMARIALETAQAALPEYSTKFSKRAFTQAQIFAILVLKTFFKTDYRGIIDLLHDLKDLRDELGLKKVPHFSTLWHAEQRLLKKGFLTYCKDLSCNEHGMPVFYEVIDGQSLTRQG